MMILCAQNGVQKYEGRSTSLDILHISIQRCNRLALTVNHWPFVIIIPLKNSANLKLSDPRILHDQKNAIYMALSENVGYIPNETAIKKRDNDQQNHWV